MFLGALLFKIKGRYLSSEKPTTALNCIAGRLLGLPEHRRKIEIRSYHMSDLVIVGSIIYSWICVFSDRLIDIIGVDLYLKMFVV